MGAAFFLLRTIRDRMPANHGAFRVADRSVIGTAAAEKISRGPGTLGQASKPYDQFFFRCAQN